MTDVNFPKTITRSVCSRVVSSIGFMAVAAGLAGCADNPQVSVNRAVPSACFAALPTTIADSSVMLVIMPMSRSIRERIVTGSGTVLAGSHEIVTAAHVGNASQRTDVTIEAFTRAGKWLGFFRMVKELHPVEGSNYVGPAEDDIAWLAQTKGSSAEAIRRFQNIPGVAISHSSPRGLVISRTAGFSVNSGFSGGGVFTPAGKLFSVVIGASHPKMVDNVVTSTTPIRTEAFTLRGRVATNLETRTELHAPRPAYMYAAGLGSNPLVIAKPTPTGYSAAGYPDWTCSSGPISVLGQFKGRAFETADSIDLSQ